jgi:hypothetical protein
MVGPAMLRILEVPSAGRGGGIRTRFFEEVRNMKLPKWYLIWGTGFSIKNGK